MSYILDALRRADAERAQGAVPDLNAQPLPMRAADDDGRSGPGAWWLWLGAGAALVLAALGAWQFLGREAGVQQAETSLPAAPAAAVPAPAPVSLPASAPATPAPDVTPPAAVRAPAAAPKPPSPAPKAAAPRPAPKRVVPKPPAPAPAPRIPKLAELPAEVRSSLPPLSIGGSVYSAQPAARMVIVNGQVVREGDTIAAGLKLEQIRAKSAVFSIRGQSFELAY
jgi:general secretion pathway protein B